MSFNQIGYTQLGSAGNIIDVTGMDEKPNIQIIITENATSSITGMTTFNGETGAEYAYRTNENYSASDGTTASANNLRLDRGNREQMIIVYMTNISDEEKLVISSLCGNGSAGASNAPDSWEAIGKWDDTSVSVEQITQTNISAGSFEADSAVQVFGAD